MNDPIYLDHNASTPLLPEVVDAMLPYLREHFGNPSSGHVYGHRAAEAVQQARARVAALVGARPQEVLFTSGGTEANNLAIRGAATARPRGRHLVTSVVEHPATTQPCALLERQGWQVSRLPVSAVGQVRAMDAAELLRPDTALLTVMLANNETGAMQPIAGLAALARAQGALVHTDAAQALGKVPVDIEALGVDLLSVAGHKLYAPKGVGALVVREGTPLEPVLLGAGHERGLRPGTENVASVVGLGVACELLGAGLEGEQQRLTRLRDSLHRALAEAIPGLALNGPPVQRLPNTLNLRFPGVAGHVLLSRCPEIAASTGSACHEGGAHIASAVVRAMGVPDDQALGSVRLSLGHGSTRSQMGRAAQALIQAWSELS